MKTKINVMQSEVSSSVLQYSYVITAALPIIVAVVLNLLLFDGSAIDLMVFLSLPVGLVGGIGGFRRSQKKSWRYAFLGASICYGLLLFKWLI